MSADGGRGPRLALAGWILSLATLTSRVLGLLRELLFAALFGASSQADAFVAAYRIPNLLRDLLAEGALQSALIPAFRRRLAAEGVAAVHRLAAVVAGNLALVVGALVLGVVALAPELFSSMTGDYARIPGKLELTILLFRVMSPFLLLVCLSAVAMSLANAHERFLSSALSPALFNVVAIGVGVALYAAGARGYQVAIGWALGTVAGGLAQLALQLPGLWRRGFRPRLALDLRLRDPEVRGIAVALVPAILGVAALQLNVLVNTIYAASNPGAVAWLNYAFRFLQLPVGVFGVAIATVSTVRYADAAARGEPAEVAGQVAQGLRMVLFLCAPATAGLLALDEPILRLLYQRGRFAARDTVASALALECYASGMIAYAGVKVMAPAFYALRSIRPAVAASVLSVAANWVANVVLEDRAGYWALALCTAGAALLNAALLYAAVSRLVAPLPHRALARHGARVAGACLVMVGTVRVTHGWIDDAIGHRTTGARLAETLVPVAIGAVVYAAAAVALRVEEARTVWNKLRTKLGSRPEAGSASAER